MSSFWRPRQGSLVVRRQDYARGYGMNDSWSRELRYLLPAWLGSVLLPWPALLWRSGDGPRVALGLFFVGSASLVAYSFRRDLRPTADGELGHPQRTWRTRLAAVT